MHQPGSPVRSDPRALQMDAGRHHRTGPGFVLMATDLPAEAGFADMAPEGVGVHVTRLWTDDVTTTPTLARSIGHMADAAARLQPDAGPPVISYGGMSGSVVCGKAQSRRA